MKRPCEMLKIIFVIRNLGIRPKDRVIQGVQTYRPLEGAPFKAKAKLMYFNILLTLVCCLALAFWMVLEQFFLLSVHMSASFRQPP